MGINKKNLFVNMKVLILLLVAVSSINMMSMPDALCKPAHNIGIKVAQGVVKCAKDKVGGKVMKKIPGAAKKMADKVGAFKIADKAVKAMEEKMVHAILSKVGCHRRLNFLKKVANGIKKVAKKAEKAAKPLANKALGMACKTFGSKCPSACDAGIKMIAAEAKKHNIPTDCASTIAKSTCHQACKDACKGK